jgi:hypothetical protein
MKGPQASTLSRALKGFFRDYLPHQRALSPHPYPKNTQPDFPSAFPRSFYWSSEK